MGAQLTDDELWKQVREDRRGAFKSFYDRFQPVLRNYASMILDSTMDVEEIVNDLLLKMWKGRHDTPPVSSVRSYMLRAVRNRCLDVLRSRKTGEGLDGVEIPVLDPSLSSLDITEISKVVDAAVEDMSEKVKTVYRKSRNEEMSDKQIAFDMGISVKTVEAEKTKALKLIREALGRLYGDDR